MGINEVSLYLNVSISELKHAIHTKTLVGGIEPPPVHTITPHGKFIFLGEDVKKAFEQKRLINGYKYH